MGKGRGEAWEEVDEDSEGQKGKKVERGEE